MSVLLWVLAVSTLTAPFVFLWFLTGTGHTLQDISQVTGVHLSHMGLHNAQGVCAPFSRAWVGFVCI